jgi:hypothetical protein
MLQELIPALKPGQKPKMLSAEPVLIEELPDIDSKISFLPFIIYSKDKQAVVSDTQSGFYNYLIKKFEAEPDLLSPVENIQLLEENADLLELLSTSLFPIVSEYEKNSYAIAAPYQFKVFYYSDCFRKLFLDGKEKNLLLPADMSTGELKKVQCSMIYDHVLKKFYNIRLNESPELIYPIVDTQTGMKRYYRMRFDNRFIDVHLKGELPPIQDCAVCLNTFRILDLEKQLKKMPLDLFEVEGFAVWVAEDVTTTESMDAIKKILLKQDECDSGVINELKRAVQALVGLSDIEIGLMPFVKVNDSFVLDEDCTMHSLVGKTWKSNDNESVSAFRAFMTFLHENPGPMPVSNVSEQMMGFAPHMAPLYKNGTRSYIHYPMQNSDGLLGFLELASPIPNLFSQEVISRLEPAIPLLSVAMLKHRDTFYHKIEKVIKEKFTALQQSVEWKFAEVAWNSMRNKNNGIDTAGVNFNNVYPLYGAVDIRNSSIERSYAIQKDLKAHLQLIDDILDQLQLLVQLPLLEGLKFNNQTVYQSIEDTMMTEDEVRVNEFLQNEVKPVFLHLQKSSNRQAQEVVDNYFEIVNDNNGRLYRFQREYEETLGTINDVVLHYLEQEEAIIQKSYPHYFEKYRTDGIEYNIYIGQSIAPLHPFDVLYLKNIRLWQLKSMAEVAKITHQLLPSLKVPFQTTQLIFIHSQCISINFRKDERRFDVEGSYNIRYEIIKKRLDKVRIKDTHERLTQPEKIAMVYTNQKDVQEYQQYIEFLQNKKILKPGIEFLELEELQGVKGLKAMRVDINLDET